MKSLPAYEQVKQAVLSYIRTHGLKPGDKLPPEAEFRRQLGWSRVTVMRGLDELEWEGIIERVKGSGNYVADFSKRKRTLRILIGTRPGLNMGHDYTGLLLQGICSEAAAQQVEVVYYDNNPLPPIERFKESGADGLLLIALALDEFHKVLPLQEQGVPLLAVASRNRGLAVPCVCTDNFGALRDAVAYLYRLGHHRVAYLTHGASSSDVQERILGYQQGLLQTGIPLNPAFLLAGGKTPEIAFLRHWWLGLPEKPTAIIVSQDLTAPMMGMMAELGVRIPDEVSLIATDDHPIFDNMTPGVTALRQPVAELGRLGLSKLLAHIKGASIGALEEILPIELVCRGTVAAPSQANS
ncbi:MAG: hypothetical protein A2X49_14940 [Lentisphaerae bacterium GWF2_52_8]|nr:MAG: hypothetical protein A2X49_14940 [Lentisphaerae bacterium GWF2_52_8]